MVFSLRHLVATVVYATAALGASLQDVTDFGPVYNTALRMQVYLPTKLAARPPIVVALHGCLSTGQQYFSSTQDYVKYADSLGAVLIYPSSQKDSNCWDVASAAALSRDKHGDNEVLVSMVNFALTKYNGDKSKVFVTGTSSGCMMTNILCATYPDVFAAATCYSGVAAGCFAGSPGSSPISSNRTCADGNIRKTGAEWAAQARAMYPGYQGAYPRFKTWHGTADNLVFYQNLVEQLKLWSTLIGVNFSRNLTQTPQSGYTTMVYGDGKALQGVSAVGVGHVVPVHAKLDFEWFGLA